MKTKTKLEQVERVTVRAELPDVAGAQRYQEIVSLLASWDGTDTNALLRQIQPKRRDRTELPALDMSNLHNPVVELLHLVNSVAERLENAPPVHEWIATSDKKPEREREFETARLIKERNLRLVK